MTALDNVAENLVNLRKEEAWKMYKQDFDSLVERMNELINKSFELKMRAQTKNSTNNTYINYSVTYECFLNSKTFFGV